MPPVNPAAPVNHLLEALPHKVRQEVRRECELVELTFGDVLHERNQRIQDVYFPTDSFISLVAAADGHASLDVGLIGNEGMLGWPLVMGVETSPLRAQVLGTGGAWRMQAGNFRRVLAATPALRHGLDLYLYVLLAQVAQTTVCAGFHMLESRLAHWLLMTHDRAHSDRFHLTHVQLAGMLGVRRSGVTMAAGALQRKKLIHYSRGDIIIIDRGGLEQASCECYGVMADTYRKILTRAVARP